MREKRKEKQTINMCYFRDTGTGTICDHAPTWKLKGEKYRFKVCDHHLPWGIRLCGLPAMVDKFDAVPGRGQFEEFRDPEYIHKDYSNRKEEDETSRQTIISKRRSMLPPPLPSDDNKK